MENYHAAEDYCPHLELTEFSVHQYYNALLRSSAQRSYVVRSHGIRLIEPEVPR
jgi:hypothetical protein